MIIRNCSICLNKRDIANQATYLLVMLPLLANFPQCIQFLALISLVYILIKILFCFSSPVYVYFCGSCPDFGKHGAWSVITGGTDGIGLAYAQELAKRGQNIVIISRNLEKLKDTAKQLQDSFGVETMTIVADFSKSDIYDRIKQKLENLDIGVLVNNVGTAYRYPEYFVELSDRSNFVDCMIAINLVSVAKMTDIILPKMASKGRGIILNISSGSADPPLALATVYTSTKQFMDCFSKCLEYEYKDKGIIIQCIMPYFVTTKLIGSPQPTLMVPTRNDYVKSSLATIGRASRSYGYIMHAIQGLVFTSVPEFLYKQFVFFRLLKIRKKYLQKHKYKKET